MDAMSLLGAPLEQSEIDELLQKYSDFEGEVPEDAKFWSRADLELFLSTGGQRRPREVAKASMATCELLTRIRKELAEQHVGEPTAEYRSFCRHLKLRRRAQQLPEVAECTEVPRVTRLPSELKGPVVMPRSRDWKPRTWSMDFWKREYGEECWKFRSRSPMFSGDVRAPDLAAVEGTVAEFVDYVRVLQRMDPACKEEQAVAFPRLSMDSWCPFAGGARRLFEACWRDLKPEGLRDLSARWMKIFAAAFNLDWLEFVARYYRVTLAAPGGISRLHVENHRAHVWFTQIEGRRVFYLFPPSQAPCLYPEPGDSCDAPEGYAAAASPVDLFFPNTKKHPRFKEAKAQVAVLSPGDTLFLPAGWWRCSAALDPAVTLHHPFWDHSNREHLAAELDEAFIHEDMPPELQERAAANMAQIHERIMDDDSDLDE